MLLGILSQYIDIGFKRVLVLFLTFLPFSVFLCSIQTQSYAQQTTKPLLPEDIIKIRTFGYGHPIEISPDGKWVAYTVRDDSKLKTIPGKRYEDFTPTGVSYTNDGCSVWITETESGRTINLGKDNSTSWGPSWSPDGKYLAFYSDRSGTSRLWIYTIGKNQFREIQGVIVRPFYGYHLPQWSPDSRKILVRVLPEGYSTEQAVDLFLGKEPINISTSIEKTRYKVFISQSSLNKRHNKEATLSTQRESIPIKKDIKLFNGLCLIDIVTDEIRRLTSDDIVNGYWISPNGQYVAYSSVHSFVGDNSQQALWDIKLISLSDGKKRTIASNVRLSVSGMNVSWSPDSKNIGYLEDGPLTNGDCFVVHVITGESVNLTKFPHPAFGDYFRVPIWDDSGRYIYCYSGGTLWKLSLSLSNNSSSKMLNLPNHEIVSLLHNFKTKKVFTLNQSIYLAAKNNDTTNISIIKFDIIDRNHTLQSEESKIYGRNLSYDVCLSTNRIVFMSESSEDPPNLWITEDEFKNRKQLSNLNPLVDNYKFGKAQFVKWTKGDGQPLRGIIHLPPNYEKGKTYPLIVFVYGGMEPSPYINYFGGIVPCMGNSMLEPHLFSTRGYAVFSPDIPINNTGTPMKDIADAVLPGIDKLVTLGIADQNRIGVRGQSYGGYSTLAILVQSESFKAAMMTSGYGNAIGMYSVMSDSGESGGMGFYEEGGGKLGGSIWQYRERYIQNSPIFYLDRIKTPLLIIHGTSDTAVPEFLADEIFVGLRRLDKEAVYVKYAHEDHGFTNTDNLLDYYRRSIEWFDNHLNLKLIR